jgi:hypothetical protein
MDLSSDGMCLKKKCEHTSTREEDTRGLIWLPPLFRKTTSGYTITGWRARAERRTWMRKSKDM